MKYKQTPNGIYIPMVDILIPRGQILFIQQNIHTGKITTDLVKNMVTTVGKEMIAQSLIGQTSKDITYCAAGTNNTAPALGNTTLGAELGRKLISTREISTLAGNQAVFTTFFTTSEINGSLKEFGLFGGAATATVNSGTLFARTLATRTKTTADTLTAVWTIAIG